jgi:hypothetical protein
LRNLNDGMLNQLVNMLNRRKIKIFDTDIFQPDIFFLNSHDQDLKMICYLNVILSLKMQLNTVVELDNFFL